MHELLNTRTAKTIAFASDIDELTPDQYVFYLDLVLQQLSGEITDPQDIKRKLFVKLTNLKWSAKMNFYTAEDEEAIWAALTEKINLLDSFFDIDTQNENKVYHLHVKSGVNLLPAWNGYTGPANMLSNITWGEFVNCLNSLKLIGQAQSEGDVTEIQNNVIDIFNNLYKKTGKHKRSLLRRAFNPRTDIPDTVLYHAQTYFSYVYELITTVPIPIDGEEVDLFIIWQPEKDDEDTADPTDKSGWHGILFSIAETGTFGTTTDVNNAKLYDVLMYLYNRKKQALAEAKKLNSTSNHGESE